MAHFGTRIRAVAIALAAGAALAACRPETPVGASVPTFARFSSPVVRPNGVRYRDAGRGPVTGRSGSAGIAAEVLVGRVSTVLAVTSFSVAAPALPAGVIAKLQVKLFDASGTLLQVINRPAPGPGPTVLTVLPSLPRGASVQVTASVQGIDGRRTDVVTVAGVRPALRPDLAALGLAVPAFAVAGVPTVIGLDVAELNGEHGGRTDCVLEVGGVERDRARGIWVDAGDQVRCAFTLTIADAGTYGLRGTAVEVEPSDWDPANNAATGTITVLAMADVGVDNLTYGADAGLGDYVQGDTTTWRWLFPDGRVYLDRRYETETRGHTERVSFAAVIGASVTSPVTRFETALSSGGQLLRWTRHDGLVLTPVSVGTACAVDGLGTAEEVYVCTGTGYTTVELFRSAGTVIYLSSGYERTWNGSAYDEERWVTNDTTSMAAAGRLAGDLAFRVQLTDGARLYGFSGTMALLPTTILDDQPERCATYPVTQDGVTYTTTACNRYLFQWVGTMGSASGVGWSAWVPAGAP